MELPSIASAPVRTPEAPAEGTEVALIDLCDCTKHVVLQGQLHFLSSRAVALHPLRRVIRFKL